MTAEAAISLLNLIRSKLFGLELPVEITEEVIDLAKKHSLQQYLSEENELIQTRTSLRQTWLVESVSAAFEKAGIDYLPLKGAVIKLLYPKIWMRSSGDIDILIHKSDLDKAKEILLQELGMEFDRESSHCWEFKMGKMSIEIHYRLINNVTLPKVVNVLGDGWKYAIKEEGHKYMLTPEAFYLYHLAHMAVHFLKGGCGMRPFVDLYLIVHKTEIDRNKLQQMLEEAGLVQFEARIREISEAWMRGEFGETEEEMLIVRGGTFGFYENSMAMNQAGSGGKQSTMLKRIFLPFREMKYRYPILEKYPVLLPVCWLRYWIWVIYKGKLKKGKKILSQNMKVDREEYNRAMRIVNAVGLGGVSDLQSRFCIASDKK